MRTLPSLLLLSSVSFAILSGCGGVVSNPNDGITDSGATETGVGDGAIDSLPPEHDDGPPPSPPAEPGATPPPRPSAVASGGTTRWFAVSKMYLGLEDRATGASSPTAWRAYGYDLDSRTTTADDSKTSTNSCKRVAGSPGRVLQDGDLGRDNNFGQHFMAVLKSLKSDIEEAVNQQILTGHSTLLLELENVGPDDNDSVPGTLYLAGALSSPTFTTSDHFPIDASSVDAAKMPIYRFPKGYMAKGTWVSGTLGSERSMLPLPFGSALLKLPLESALISFHVASGKAGVFAGAIPASAFSTALAPAAAQFGICPGNATYEQLVLTFSQSADLVSGAPQLQDVTKECNAVSLGIGFDVAPTGAPSGIVTPATPPDDCSTLGG